LTTSLHLPSRGRVRQRGGNPGVRGGPWGLGGGNTALGCGADDLGSMMIDENVVAAAFVSVVACAGGRVQGMWAAGLAPARRRADLTRVEVRREARL
jgi:hypothetical protein